MPGYRDRAVRAYVIAHLDDFVPSDMEDRLRESIKDAIASEFDPEDADRLAVVFQDMAAEWAEIVKGGDQQ